MKVLREPSEVVAFRAGVHSDTAVAMVPTMGFLHEGHLKLVDEARRRVGPDGLVLMTIFVNPTQFDSPDDLATYPRDEAADLENAGARGVDVVFAPPRPEVVYDPAHATWVEVEGLDQHLCGANRPGHFRGVCTVVTKLWNLVRPHFGVFGEKDYQQLAIIRRLHADLFLSGEVVGVPIERETDGLARSSRNARLSPEAREEALAISRGLRDTQALFTGGERGAAALLSAMNAALGTADVDYVSLVDAATLQPIDTVARPALLAVAVRYGGVRLIDNTVLRP